LAVYFQQLLQAYPSHLLPLLLPISADHQHRYLLPTPAAAAAGCLRLQACSDRALLCLMCSQQGCCAALVLPGRCCCQFDQCQPDCRQHLTTVQASLRQTLLLLLLNLAAYALCCHHLRQRCYHHPAAAAAGLAVASPALPAAADPAAAAAAAAAGC
jgi:hypothetical protein